MFTPLGVNSLIYWKVGCLLYCRFPLALLNFACELIFSGEFSFTGAQGLSWVMETVFTLVVLLGFSDLWVVKSWWEFGLHIYPQGILMFWILKTDFSKEAQGSSTSKLRPWNNGQIVLVAGLGSDSFFLAPWFMQVTVSALCQEWVFSFKNSP